jgi:hypothetical protein
MFADGKLRAGIESNRVDRFLRVLHRGSIEGLLLAPQVHVVAQGD